MTKQNAADPQNDRELLLQLAGEVKRLSQSIDKLDKTLEEIENKKIAGLEKKLENLDKWKNQEVGKWKALTIIVAVLSVLSLILTIINAGK